MKFSLTNYTVQYPTQTQPLLEKFSFECEASGLYLIHGANGAGKSTLFATIQGQSLCATTAGTIVIQDQEYDLASDVYKKYAQHAVGLVPQKYDELLAPQYSVRENLAIALFPSIPSVLQQMESVAISDVISSITIPFDIPVECLSGGQRQITAIMMALQKPRKMLLLDEPTATLDPANTSLVMNFLVQLSKKTEIVILMICHDHDLQKYTQHKPIIVGK